MSEPLDIPNRAIDALKKGEQYLAFEITVATELRRMAIEHPMLAPELISRATALDPEGANNG